MEVTPYECYVITEALIRLATNPNNSSSDRDKAKKLAYQINKEHENTSHADEQRNSSPSHQ